MRLRCRGPKGQTNLTNITAETTGDELLRAVIAQCGLTDANPAQVELAAGFPPTAIDLSDGQKTLAQLGVQDGDTLVAKIAAEVRRPVAGAAPASGARTASEGGPAGSALDSVPLNDGTAARLVRRQVPSDNSCLFRSIGYVLEKTMDAAGKMRATAAQVVSSDATTYNGAFLGRENEEYVAWILDDINWGGAIELSIFSQVFLTEIAAFDVQTRRVDVYGEGSGHEQRVMVVYNGIHYDPLVVVEKPGAPQEEDVALLEVGSARCDAAMAAAAELVRSCNEQRKFTDVAGFSLRCGVCEKGLKGQKEATEHAAATGHANFVEF
ncbi:unnamed protein product [Pedinophyceae sp. YPF-701]|nr:unnamed protein product [Pedinophyceae sp. YPF-701]